MASTRSEIDRAPRLPDERPLGVDGMPFVEWAEPASVTELAAALREATASGRAITPIGGGTKLALGNVPARVDFGLSTALLDRVLHYEPTDMTLSVEAGIRFGELQSLLAERGQTLPVETPDDERATIGGLIATAFAGPRRLGSGTLRDLIIGIAIAYPDGTLGKAGGLVVKNVTGFDLMRLHLGALGTLGVIVSANFKVLPLARAEATLVSPPLTIDEALRTCALARQSRLRPLAAEVFAGDGGWVVAIRIEGRPQTVALGASNLRSVTDWSQNLTADASHAWWRSYVARQSLAADDGVLVRLAVQPKESVSLVTRILALIDRSGIAPLDCAISPGLGTVILRLNAGGFSPDGLAAFQREVAEFATAATILQAPPALKAGIDVWGRVPDTVSVMRALKHEFDPAGTLNPGRYVDRI